MTTDIDPRLTYWIAIGNNHGWGRSDKSEKEAVARMHSNGMGMTREARKATEFTVWRCSPATQVEDVFGNLIYPADDPKPVKVTHYQSPAIKAKLKARAKAQAEVAHG